MGLKAPPATKGQNGHPGISVGRKRGLTVTTSGSLPNQRGLSQATLQRIFMTMMGLVLFLWSTITVVVIRWGHTSLDDVGTQGSWGPSEVSQNNKQAVLDHIHNLRKDHQDTAKPLGVQQKKLKTPEKVLRPKKQIHRPKTEHKDLEDVDPHGMWEYPQKTKGDASIPSAQILKAYLEPIHLGEWEQKPLPVRNVTKQQLTTIEYATVDSCQRLPELWPTDDFPGADPFLPWIHDVFPTDDGKFIQFVAQNKRRCQTGTTPDQIDILEKMQPQISLFQHVPVKRVTVDGTNDTRYKLTSHEEADPDGIETRFICRFSNGQETLSRFNINYDYIAARKRANHVFSREGHKDGKTIHTSQLIFQCPVPESLVDTVREGTSVINDWATLFVTLVPIRTPPRYGAPGRFLPPKYQFGSPYNFSVSEEWGNAHVLPRVEDSGRWENIPICLPTYKAYPTVTSPPKEEVSDASIAVRLRNSTKFTKKHRVVACTWAASSYSTRGDRFQIDDGIRRADEWIRFHLLTGIDHIFVYDNSQGGDGLKDVTDQFPGRVTRIRWPSKICNNNRNFHDSPGERSSQYAAESSCRLRFGPHTDWMAGMDIDEYITPVGNYTSIQNFLTALDDEGTKIVNFGSWRAWPRRDLIEEPVPIVDKEICDEPYPCFDLKVSNKNSILQTYNCDRQLVKTEKMPAEKQIYRTDYVLQHFVHFSTATVFTMMSRDEAKAVDLSYSRVAPDPLSRFANEQTEVTMLHTKAIATQDTAGWEKRCTGEMKRGTCRIGVPFPSLAESNNNATKDGKGWLYNCYVNPKIEHYWAPLLHKELERSKIIDFGS